MKYNIQTEEIFVVTSITWHVKHWSITSRTKKSLRYVTVMWLVCACNATMSGDVDTHSIITLDEEEGLPCDFELSQHYRSISFDDDSDCGEMDAATRLSRQNSRRIYRTLELKKRKPLPAPGGGGEVAGGGGEVGEEPSNDSRTPPTPPSSTPTTPPRSDSPNR